MGSEVDQRGRIEVKGKVPLRTFCCGGEMNKTRSIAKVVKIVNLYEADNDFEWWQSQPYTARLAALEEMRRAYCTWKYGTPEPRLQRVVRIVKQSHDYSEEL